MKNIIMQRMNCEEAKAERLAVKLSTIEDALKPMLNEWLENGTETSDVEFGGYSINSLMEKHSMKFTGAILTLDWLIRDPKTATMAIKQGIK